MASRSQARSRKVFRYPDDDDDLPEALDEEEQEKLISTFRAQEAQMTTRYTRIFTVFPCALIFAYLPPLYTSLGGRGTGIPILAITSLLCTAWMMHSLPAGRTGILPLDNLVSSFNDGASEKSKGKRPMTLKGDIIAITAERPVEKFLPILNACLAGLILVMGRLASGSAMGEREDVISKGLISGLPILAMGMVVGAKVMVGSVGVEELEKLKYGYKGA